MPRSNFIIRADQDGFAFLDPGNLTDGIVRLYLAETLPANPSRGWVPCYLFHIYCAATGSVAGEIRLRIGNTEDVLLYVGHIGYRVEPEHRGRHFAARAVGLLTGLAVRHGLEEVWITCNPENIASRRTCELSGAEFVEIIDVPPHTALYQRGDKRKCRYRLKLQGERFSKDSLDRTRVDI